MPGPDDAAARQHRDPVARRGSRPRRGDRRHRRRPDRGHARRAAPELDGERATLLPLRDRDADRVRRVRVLRQVRGASKGPAGSRRRAADLPPPGARAQPRPDGPEHEGVARLLHRRSSARTRTASCASSRSRATAVFGRAHPHTIAFAEDDFLTRVERGRGRPAVLRDRARGRAPVVGRTGEGRRGARARRSCRSRSRTTAR